MKYEIYFKTWSLYHYNGWTYANMCTYQQLNAIYIYAGQNHYHNIFFQNQFLTTFTQKIQISQKSTIFCVWYFLRSVIAKTRRARFSLRLSVFLSFCLSVSSSVILFPICCFAILVRDILLILLLYIYQ